MKFIHFGLQEVPPIGMGTWHMGENDSNSKEEIKALRTGIEHGLTLIDTAEMYGEGLAESLVGEAIKTYRREELTIVTKVFPWNGGSNNVRTSLENSLKRLQTEYVDMYLLHWRGEIPLEETVDAFEQLKKEGKIRAWGVSNFDVSDMEVVTAISNSCATNQVLYNLSSRGTEFDLQPWMNKKQMPMMAYTPLGQGDTLHAGFRQNTVLQEIADRHECSIFQLLLAWTIRSGNVIAIPQSSNKEHVVANAEAINITLSQEDLEKMNKEYPAPSHKVPLEEL